MSSNRLEKPNRATQSVVRDVLMPRWLIRPTTKEIPKSMRRNIAALAGLNEANIKRQLDKDNLPLVAGANNQQDAETLARDFGVSGIEFEVIQAKSGLSGAAIIFSSVVISIPLTILFGLVGLAPIPAGIGWILVRGAPDRQSQWNALHGVIDKNKGLKEVLEAIQLARKAVILGDLSPIIIHDLNASLDTLEDNLDKHTISGKQPSQEILTEMISAAQALEQAALSHQDIDVSAAKDAKSKAEILKNTSGELR